MWLFKSSIGRKLIMSISGIALVLFLTFHGCMNVVAIFSKDAYNQICSLLGSNWYAILATAGLGALVAIHFIYAFILTFQNRKARGNNKYAVTDKPAKVEWASQNMLVLGIIIVLGLLLHLFNFWYNMMFAEIIGQPTMGGYEATDGFSYIQQTFSNPVFVTLYVIWLIALWFHLTHGIWSSFQTLGVSGHVWFNRWKNISYAWATVVILCFLAVAIAFAICPDSLGNISGKVVPFAM